MTTKEHMEMPFEYQSRQPDNTALKQQKLHGYHLRFSATAVLSIFFTTGFFCLCMGIILILSAKSTKKIEINYTKLCADCHELREDASQFRKACTCSIPFKLPEKMKGNVYMYYKLYGFYQNLYRYVLSRSNTQLMGKNIMNVHGCDPFKMSEDKIPFIPCGAIANSMFNDTIILSYSLHASEQIQVPMLKNGLAWWTDKYIKFQNPVSSNLAGEFEGSAKPPSWSIPIYELDSDDPRNNGFLNEDFIVWMRTAAFPTFKKLYRRLSREHYFKEGLPADFPVTRFQGEKSVVLSTLTWSGGDCLFLGLAYTVTGALTWLSAFAIMAIYLMLKNKKEYLSL